MSNVSQLDLFRTKLPKKPYCSDDLQSGLLIRNVQNAAQMRYIQPNHPNSKLWLLYDIDRASSPEELTDDLGLPSPTIWVGNPKNGHAHALYALETPVHLNENSSRSAIRYAAAVDVGLSTKMQADAGYVGLICKNPLNEHWRTYPLAGSYDLNELSDYVDLDSYRDKRRHFPEIGLGRNCTLFDQVRKWAYKAIRQGWPTYNQWFQACLDRANGYNTRFNSPLPANEVQHTARSIAKWTHRNMTEGGWSEYVARTHTSEIQAVRGSKGGKVSKRKADESSERTLKPWEVEGISRATYYRRKNETR
jgi:hypothetical protein